MPGITLLEATKIAKGDVYRDAIVEIYAKNSDVLLNIPFKTIAGNAYHYVQEDTLTPVAFRAINAAWTPNAGRVTTLTEHLTVAGGELDVDRVIVKTQGPSVRAAHEAMQIKHLAAQWTFKFLKGDNTATPAEFDGLQARCTGAGNLLTAGAGAGGTALSLAILDQAIDMVVNPTHLIMSRAMRRLLTAAARTPAVGGHMDFQLDQFGRRIALYGDLPILIADRLGDYYAGLAFNEVCSGGGGVTGTSIYVVSFGDGMLQGIQNGLPEVKDFGEISSAPVYRTRVEWLASVVMEHKFAAARLYSIANAAVTA